MFMVKLAWANIRHRATRTTITIFAMALAAAIVTSGMSLSQGIAKMADDGYRTYYRGDTVVFTPTYVGASALYDVDSSIHNNVLYDSGFNPLLKLYPHFGTDGYLGYELYPYTPLSLDQMERLRSFPGVNAVEPVLIMPGRIGLESTSLKITSTDMAALLTEGAMPSSGTIDMLEIVVNAYGGPQLAVGDVVNITVPVFGFGASGVPYADITAPAKEWKARVVGLVRWPTRELSYLVPSGSSPDPIFEQGYVHSSEVYLTEAAWQEIWSQQSGGMPYPVLAATQRVDNLSTLNVVAAELRAAFPELTIKTVPEVARHVETYNLLDWFYELPQEYWKSQNGLVTHNFVPVELGMISSILLFANAGMLLASQMLSGIAERKKEIGILKAIGARNREILGMVLIEGLFLAITGSLLGFSFTRALAIHRDSTNNLPWLTIMNSTLRELLSVVSLTTLVALVFSGIPAAKTAQLSVMEVLRND